MSYTACRVIAHAQVDDEAVQDEILVVKLWDQDAITDDSIGHVMIDLHALVKADPVPQVGPRAGGADRADCGLVPPVRHAARHARLGAALREADALSVWRVRMACPAVGCQASCTLRPRTLSLPLPSLATRPLCAHAQGSEPLPRHVVRRAVLLVHRAAAGHASLCVSLASVNEPSACLCPLMHVCIDRPRSATGCRPCTALWRS